MTQPKERIADSLNSADGILKSAATLGTLYLAYWAAKSIMSALQGAKGGLEDMASAWRNEGKASRDMQETLRRQEEKDTKQIRKNISDDWIERERSKVKLRPTSVRGHWEGNVFIPTVEATKPPKPKRP